MALYKYEPYHGAVLHRLIRENTEGNLVIKPGINKYAYLIRKAQYDEFRVDKTVGLFVKYSSKRLSPWRYSIYKEEQEEIELLKEVCNTVYLVLVNGKEGIACLDYDNIKELLDDTFEDHEWLSVSTKLRKEYTIKGKDGNLQRKIPRNLYPKIVIDRLNEISG